MDTHGPDDGWIAGADGYRDGWVVVLWRPATDTVRHRTVETADALFALPEAPAVLGVDMPIGCPDAAAPGGRPCDRRARRRLGHPRGASVFSPPAHEALQADTYDEACRRNRASGPDAPGLSKLTFHLFPKLRALAAHMTPERQERVREVHPELAFYAMNGDAPVDASKHTETGRAARLTLLAENGVPDVAAAVETMAVGPVGADDVIDAHAACWTARRIRDGTAGRCPPRDETASRTARGLRMEIWR